MTSPLFPLFLKLEGARVVVVGGGPMGAHKARDLLVAGPRVIAIAPSFDAAWDDLDGERIERIERAFAPGDAQGARIVVAATGVLETDRAVADDGHAHGALVNIVDVMEGSDFYTGGVVRRGPLTISIGTSGNSPALARRVRMLVDEALPAGLSPLAQALGEARPRLLARHPDFKARAALLDAFVAASIARLTTTTTPEDVHAWIERELLTGDA